MKDEQRDRQEHRAATEWADAHTRIQDAPDIAGDEYEREESGARYVTARILEEYGKDNPDAYETTPPAAMHSLIITPADAPTRHAMERHAHDIAAAGLVYIADADGRAIGAGCFDRSAYPWCDPCHALYLAMHEHAGAIDAEQAATLLEKLEYLKEANRETAGDGTQRARERIAAEAAATAYQNAINFITTAQIDTNPQRVTI